jgi:hypothetical protein
MQAKGLQIKVRTVFQMTMTPVLVCTKQQPQTVLVERPLSFQVKGPWAWSMFQLQEVQVLVRTMMMRS